MRKADKQYGIPYEDYTDTKANIEALTGVSIGAHATATNNPTAPFGSYDGAWKWSSGEAGGVSSLAFQRVLTADLTLADGESLVVSEYINTNGHDIILNGDSVLQIL